MFRRQQPRPRWNSVSGCCSKAFDTFEAAYAAPGATIRGGPHHTDRILWWWLSRLWAGWRSSLVIVQPATVLAWPRQGFHLYWRWKSRRRSAGRPPIDLEIRTLIRRMARENPTWGRRRIQAELRFLGYEVAGLTVAKYMRRLSPRPSAP